jgi:zinc protease
MYKPAVLVLAAGLALTGFVLITERMLTNGKAGAAGFVNDWAHLTSDVKVDPAITFGKLPNGMRYAIQHNNTPTGALSLRLRIDAGSMQETDAQRGIAHLLEHVAFRGSKNFPDGEVVKTMERLGLGFGADTNASTNFTETIYKFDLPKATDANLLTGLLLLRDIAGNLSITDEALKTERGVVMSEWRLSDTPGVHARRAVNAFALSGQRLPLRSPIGVPEVIQNADAALLRSYYSAYYRPERATLVIVGDIDQKATEKLVTDHFSDWVGTGPFVGDPDFGTPAKRGLEAKAYFEPGLPTSVSASWIKPFDPNVETNEGDRAQYYETLARDIVNERFERAAAADGVAFTSAGVSISHDIARSAAIGSLTVTSAPDAWKPATRAARAILEQALAGGVTQAEVDRVVANQRAVTAASAAGAATRATRSLADNIVYAVETFEVPEDPKLWAVRFNAMLDGLTAETVTAALRRSFSGSGPAVFLMSAQPVANAEADLLALFTEPVAAAPAAVAAADVVWPYTAFGPAGTVTSRSVDKELDATQVTFANGVELVVRRTPFKDAEIKVDVDVGSGLSGLGKDRRPATEFLSTLVDGGLKGLDLPSINKIFAGKTATVVPSLSNANLNLSGLTTPADLEVQLQLLAAYVTEPAYRAYAFERTRERLLANLPQSDGEAMTSLARQSSMLLRSGDQRWAPATMESVTKARLEDLTSWLGPVLKDGQIAVKIVGDVDVERAISLTAATLGSLPQRPPVKRNRFPAGELVFPSATAAPLVMRHTGTDKAAVMVAWPGPEFANKDAAAARVLAEILQSRATETIRARMGAGYSPFASYQGAFSATGFGPLILFADVKPDLAEAFVSAVNDIAADLRDKPVSADEFERALRPAVAREQASDQDNSFLADWLPVPGHGSAYKDYLLTHVKRIEAVTSAEVHAAAQKYLVADKAYKVLMLPKAK